MSHDEFGRVQAEAEVHREFKRMPKAVFEGTWYELYAYGRLVATSECLLQGGAAETFAHAFATSYNTTRKKLATPLAA